VDEDATAVPKKKRKHANGDDVRKTDPLGLLLELTLLSAWPEGQKTAGEHGRLCDIDSSRRRSR